MDVGVQRMIPLTNDVHRSGLNVHDAMAKNAFSRLNYNDENTFHRKVIEWYISMAYVFERLIDFLQGMLGRLPFTYSC